MVVCFIGYHITLFIHHGMHIHVNIDGHVHGTSESDELSSLTSHRCVALLELVVDNFLVDE